MDGNDITFGCHDMIADKDFMDDYKTFLEYVYASDDKGYFTRVRTYNVKQECIEDIFKTFNKDPVKNRDELRDSIRYINDRLNNLMEIMFLRKYKFTQTLEKEPNATLLFRIDRSVSNIMNNMFTNIQVIINKYDMYYDKINTININVFNEDEYVFKKAFITMFWRYIEIHMYYTKCILDVYLKFIIMWNREELLNKEMRDYFSHYYKKDNSSAFDCIDKLLLEVQKEHTYNTNMIDYYFRNMKDRCNEISRQANTDMTTIKMMCDYLRVSCMGLHSHLCTTIIEIGDHAKLMKDAITDPGTETARYVTRKINVLVFFMTLLQNKVASHYITPAFLDPLRSTDDEKSKLEDEAYAKEKLGNMVEGKTV